MFLLSSSSGPGAIFHGPFLTILCVCSAVGVLAPIALWMVPDSKRWKRWLPTPVLLGTGALYGGVNFMCMTMLIIGVVYQWYIKTRHPHWYDKFQHVSTSGVNAGVGLSGLLVVLFAVMGLPTVRC